MNAVRLFACGFLLVAAGHVSAQAWPAKPVRFIVAVALGTGPDVVTRLVADRLSRRMNRSFFVENMPGGAGHIAAQAAARAAPDGYTFFVAGAGIIAIDPGGARAVGSHHENRGLQAPMKGETRQDLS